MVAIAAFRLTVAKVSAERPWERRPMRVTVLWALVGSFLIAGFAQFHSAEAQQRYPGYPVAPPVGRGPLVTTPEGLARMMGGTAYICDSGTRFSVNTATPVSVQFFDPTCNATFINGRTSKIADPQNCKLPVFLGTFDQSVSVRNGLITFEARESANDPARVLNRRGTGLVRGVFDPSSGRLTLTAGRGNEHEHCRLN